MQKIISARAELHCEKESTRVFDFGIEVRTAGIEVRDHSSQNGLVLQYHLFVVIYNFNTKIGTLNHIFQNPSFGS